MAAFTMTDCLVIVNGVTLSDHSNEVTVEDTRAEVDFTAFGATSIITGKGLGDANMSIKMFQDYAAGKTHATLQPLIASTTPVTVEVRPTSAARSATNPAAVMSALMFNYNFLDGAIGDAAMTTADFKNAAAAGITYPTS